MLTKCGPAKRHEQRREQRRHRARRKNTSKKTAGPVTLPRQSRCPSAAAGCIRHCCTNGDPSAPGTVEAEPEPCRPTSSWLRWFSGAPARHRRRSRYCLARTSRRCALCRAPRPYGKLSEGRPIGVGRRSPSNYRRDSTEIQPIADPFSGRHPICRVRSGKSTPVTAGTTTTSSAKRHQQNTSGQRL